MEFVNLIRTCFKSTISFLTNRPLILDDQTIDIVAENQNDISENYNTGPNKSAITPYDSSGLDNPVLAQDNNSSVNVHTTTSQDLTGCPMPELLLQHQARR